ncbi:MAG: tyrosine-type recombinase/integrase [Malacoplasma sp.]
MKIKNDFSTILDSYFTRHLKLERKFSTNTYTTYLMVLKQFIVYLDEVKKIRRTKIMICDFSKDNILDFLNYVEINNKCSVKTRNHKLTIINSYLEYAQSINPIYLSVYLSSKSIKVKRTINKKMDYMTILELKSYFECINLKHKSGYKHYVMLTVLYETAARVSELINIKVSDVYFSENPYIRIIGKGSKERLVYINDSVVTMIKEYMQKFNITDGYLFLNHSNKMFTRYGINKIVDKYYELAKNNCPTLINKNISPHTFRHAKAVHFLQNGTALPIIQRFLGHSNIQTTEIYLDITNDVVIEAVKLAANTISDNKEKALWEGDESLISLLESLSN